MSGSVLGTRDAKIMKTWPSAWNVRSMGGIQTLNRMTEQYNQRPVSAVGAAENSVSPEEAAGGFT